MLIFRAGFAKGQAAIDQMGRHWNGNTFDETWDLIGDANDLAHPEWLLGGMALAKSIKYLHTARTVQKLFQIVATDELPEGYVERSPNEANMQLHAGGLLGLNFQDEEMWQQLRGDVERIDLMAFAPSEQIIGDASQSWVHIGRALVSGSRISLDHDANSP